ncbi:MAG: putative DNA-binding protein [Sarcina sp.]
MEDRFEISILLDYYDSLLTDKQRNIMNLYYNDDLSLAEIAELNNTSRQAIYDLIKRCYKQLVTYEEKLQLLKKTIVRMDMKDELIQYLKNNNLLGKDLIDHIDNDIEEIINA